jgi:Zn-dependent alcohol dehydrogenase
MRGELTPRGIFDAAREGKARALVVVDTVARRMALAIAAIAPIIDLTHGVMAEKTIIAVGEMRGEYIEEAMTLTAKTGTCVVTGMGAMTDVDVKLNLFLFTMLQKTLKGNIFGGGSSHVDTPKLVGLYKSGLLKIDEMVTNTYALEDINDGYQDMIDGKNIRGVIKFSESDW